MYITKTAYQSSFLLRKFLEAAQIYSVLLSKTNCASESREKLFKNLDVQHLNVKAKTIKPLGEYLGVNLHDRGLGNRFLDMTPEV